MPQDPPKKGQRDKSIPAQRLRDAIGEQRALRQIQEDNPSPFMTGTLRRGVAAADSVAAQRASEYRDFKRQRDEQTRKRRSS